MDVTVTTPVGTSPTSVNDQYTYIAAPTVINVTSSIANGTYGTGTVIPVTVQFSAPVIVTGTPQLTLSTGSPSSTAVNYASGSGTDTLTFNYTVAAGNNAGDLNYATTGSLGLNSGTIKDGDRQQRDLDAAGHRWRGLARHQQEHRHRLGPDLERFRLHGLGHGRQLERQRRPGCG